LGLTFYVHAECDSELTYVLVGKCARAIKMLSGYIGSTPEVKELMDGWQSVVEFDLRGEEPFHLAISGNTAEFRQGKAERADVILASSSDVFFDVITGKLDADEAFMMKRYTVKGSVIDAMKFRRISEMTEEHHKTVFSFLKTASKIAFK
jgi:putative sterol carrier protein